MWDVSSPRYGVPSTIHRLWRRAAVMDVTSTEGDAAVTGVSTPRRNETGRLFMHTLETTTILGTDSGCVCHWAATSVAPMAAR